MKYSLYKRYSGKDSPAIKRKMFDEMPDIPGFEKVYMPYGERGAGFYYAGDGDCIIKTGHFSITETGAKKLFDEMEKILFGN